MCSHLLKAFLNNVKIRFSISSRPLRLPEIMLTVPTHGGPGVTSCNQHLRQSNCVLRKEENLIRNLKARMIWQMSPVICLSFLRGFVFKGGYGENIWPLTFVCLSVGRMYFRKAQCCFLTAEVVEHSDCQAH